MCLLVVCDANSTPSEEELLQGACRNPDGFGFAIMTPDGIISERTMSAKKSIKRFLELRAEYPSAYAMWHCRIATQGVKNELNCHPFQVGGDSRTYLAHNGMLSLPMEDSDRRSDTRLFAEEVLPAMGGVAALDNPQVFHILEKWATGSKIVVMTTDPAAKYNLYILNEKAGEWDEHGVWWSNTYHRPAPVKTYPNYYARGYDSEFYNTHKWNNVTRTYEPVEGVVLAPKELPMRTSPTDDNLYQLFSDEVTEELDSCPNCWALLDLAIIEENYCPNCSLCFDCGDSQGYCLCYNMKDYSDSHQGSK
jgi:glutamine amidotransferase